MKKLVTVLLVGFLIGVNIYDGVMFVYYLKNGNSALAGMYILFLVIQTVMNTIIFTNAIRNKRLF